MMHQTDRRQQQYCQDHIEYLSIKVTAQTIPDQEQHQQVISREIREIRDFTIPFL